MSGYDMDEVVDLVVDLAETDWKGWTDYFKDRPPYAHTLTDEQHALWMEQMVAKDIAQQEAEGIIGWNTPRGPVMGASGWLLSRPYSEGGLKELRRYERTRGMTGEGPAEGEVV